MTGRRIGLIGTLLVLAVAAGTGALLWGLQQVPDFYEEALAEQPDRKLRQEAARKFVQRTVDLREDLKHSDRWSQEFTQDQVNAWLAEELHTKFSDVVPEGVRDPRVKFAADAILVGFHYSDSRYSGVISARLRPWMIEPNRLAVEIESVKAGAVPVPVDEFLEMVDQGLSHDGWQIESGQVHGNQVLVLNFVPAAVDEPILDRLKVVDGKLEVAGTRVMSDGGNPAPRPTHEKRTAAENSPHRSPRLADHSPSD